MRKTPWIRLVVLGVLTALGALTLAPGAQADTRLSTDLTGSEEAPGPGDPNATGFATLRLNQGTGTVCSDISWANVDGEVFAAHIHVGAAGSAGPVVVTLFTGSFSGTDSFSGCTEGVDRELIKAIRKNPTAYYVNVHSRPDFLGGAIRGQLGD
jgi:hypothetical protein